MGYSIYIRCFLKRFFARIFKILTQSDHFAKATALASWSILAIFKILGVFSGYFVINFYACVCGIKYFVFFN